MPSGGHVVRLRHGGCFDGPHTGERLRCATVPHAEVSMRLHSSILRHSLAPLRRVGVVSTVTAGISLIAGCGSAASTSDAMGSTSEAVLAGKPPIGTPPIGPVHPIGSPPTLPSQPAGCGDTAAHHRLRIPRLSCLRRRQRRPEERLLPLRGQHGEHLPVLPARLPWRRWLRHFDGVRLDSSD